MQREYELRRGKQELNSRNFDNPRGREYYQGKIWLLGLLLLSCTHQARRPLNCTHSGGVRFKISVLPYCAKSGVSQSNRSPTAETADVTEPSTEPGLTPRLRSSYLTALSSSSASSSPAGTRRLPCRRSRTNSRRSRSWWTVDFAPHTCS